MDLRGRDFMRTASAYPDNVGFLGVHRCTLFKLVREAPLCLKINMIWKGSFFPIRDNFFLARNLHIQTPLPYSVGHRRPIN